MEQSDLSESNIRDSWNVFGYSIPKMEVVFFSQIVVLYIVIITCLTNLSLGCQPTELWVSLISSSIGYLLPNPTIKQAKIITPIRNSI
jgi:hypothetical protein